MKRAVLAFVLTLTAFSIAAFDFTGSGFIQEGGGVSGSKTVTLVDETGSKLLFDMEVDPSPERLGALKSVVTEIRSWKNLAVADLKATNTASNLRIVVVPSSFAVQGVDLEHAVPEGIQIYYDSAIEYDFRVMSGEYIVRLNSVYTNEDDLDAAIISAFKDPAAFLEARDPLYIQKRLDQLSVRLGALEAMTSPSTIGQSSASDTPWSRARVAILAALNGGKWENDASAAKLDELKKANPQLSKADAAEKLKAAGFPMTKAELSAIYLVDFGER